MKKHARLENAAKMVTAKIECLEKIEASLVVLETTQQHEHQRHQDHSPALQQSTFQQQPQQQLDSRGNDLITSTSRNCQGSFLRTFIQQLANSNSTPHQIRHLKQLMNHVQRGEMSDPMELRLTIQALIMLCLDPSVQKSSLHKAATSCLESVKDCVSKELCSLDCDVENVIYEQLVWISDAKEYITAVKWLLDCPPSSVRYETALLNVSELTLNFSLHLTKCLQQIDPLCCHGDSQMMSDNVSLAHTACQVFFRLLSVAGSVQVEEDVRQACESVKDVLYSTMIKGHGNMDLLVSIGLCLLQLLIIECQSHDEQTRPDILLSKLKLLINRQGETTSPEHDQLSHCCLLNGLVCCLRNLPLQLNSFILSSVKEITTVKMNTSLLLVFMKMLVRWTSTLRDDEVVRNFIENEVYYPLFEYLLLVWEHSAETVRQCSRDVFSNLLKSVNNSDIRSDTLQRLTQFAWSCKGKYGFLLEYMWVVGVDSVLDDLGPEALLSQVIVHMKQQQLANYVSEFICCTLTCDKKVNSYTSTQWTNRWLLPLVKVIELHPQAHMHVNQNLLPRIIKIWPETVVELLKRMGRGQRSHDQSADIYLMLARRARTCGLLDECMQGDGMWCQVLSKSLVQNGLHSPHSKTRLSAFALVCESHKTSSLIQSYEFEWVEEFVRDNSYHPEPCFRQQMLSHLKHFLYHVLESSRKLDSLHQHPYKEFLRNLGNSQIERLRLMSLANHRTVALEILTLISQIFPAGSFGVSRC